MSHNIDAQLVTDLGKDIHLLARAEMPLMEQLAGWASYRMILRNTVPTAKRAEGLPGNGQVIDPALGLRPGQRSHTGNYCLIKTVSEVLIKMHSSSQFIILGYIWPTCCCFTLLTIDC